MSRLCRNAPDVLLKPQKNTFIIFIMNGKSSKLKENDPAAAAC